MINYLIGPLGSVDCNISGLIIEKINSVHACIHVHVHVGVTVHLCGVYSGMCIAVCQLQLSTSMLGLAMVVLYTVSVSLYQVQLWTVCVCVDSTLACHDAQCTVF